jgi:predicted nucleic acid-binding Zn ribbon protein
VSEDQPGASRAPGDPAAVDRARLAAREALASAKADARARGDAPMTAGGMPAGRSRGGSANSPPGPPRRLRRARRDDPQPLNAAIQGLLSDQGWQAAAAVGSVFGRWPQIVGADLAAHTRPDRLTDGELVVIADSTAWATQVRLLARTLIRRLNTELGDGTVTRVQVRGPEQPRRPGKWSVRGGRGPRDTYG